MGAKIRNRYNQVPHLTQDTNGKVTNLGLLFENILFYYIWAWWPFWSNDLNIFEPQYVKTSLNDEVVKI